ncbi:AI-2E family transporter [Ginsengibacter hankyongi]|uniref:AI-2E family transporter n=1 Tax=Ginsengibacter hankyongi TaxID=2607284 RepID=A0A5J5IMM4_9BACT|nr:AI-2E family transporter [Ginsengibacter hankyongi]KAA9042199.1 AI-2E family transporter [Ginsengibacter hankyongi]
MIINNQSPFYVKLGFKFLVIFFICYFINVAQNILIPFAFACLLAVFLLPVVNFFQAHKIPRVLSIAFSIILAIGFIVGVIYFLSSQIANFMQDIPSIKQHLNDHFITLQNWVKEKFHISFQEQNEYLNEQADKLKETGTGYISHTFFSITEAIMLVILMPIYTFLLLFYKDHIRNFLFSIFKQQHAPGIRNVLSQTKLMIRSYMTGLLIEMAIVATANSTGLVLIGIKYAIFFGVFAAVLNLIPYVGMFTATLFTVLVSLTTTDSTGNIVWIIVIFYSIHIVDVNFLMPRIVASRLRVNALVSILGVVIGGALTGISGLFLSIPVIAFTKIVCDEVEELKPWGLLMGDETTYSKKSKLYKKLEKISIKKISRSKRQIKD